MSVTENLVTSVAALEALYDAPPWAAVAKETDTLIAPYRAFIELAPYLTLATVGAEGVDCSPRGDAPGFVRILDEKTLLIPNRNGNNRIESLRNIVRDPRIAIHFLIPGCAESLRLKGRAAISADPALTASLAIDGKVRGRSSLSLSRASTTTVRRPFTAPSCGTRRRTLIAAACRVRTRFLPLSNGGVAATPCR
jgi:predicted pyridoxine 5'-phosphate oxidase superfamily flavin-nucleotide-binding protein